MANTMERVGDIRMRATALAGELANRAATCTLQADDAEEICSMLADLSQALLDVMNMAGVE